ncbi:MAG TPA: FAD-binding oxidoreductase [Gaiellaceae bacterium]|nr:FAD-binding oxidoreductase [Gaiellaceae bacterium]
MSARAAWRFRPWRVDGRSGRSSLWIEEALAAEPDAWAGARRLEGRVRADVCVVGGGFTGLWTAIRLRELDPSLTVVLVEAELCGTGASGRNGGMVSDWWVKLPTLIRYLGRDDALTVAAAIEAGAREIDRFCGAEGIDAEISFPGLYWTATNAAQVATIEQVVAAADAAGVGPFRVVPRDELIERLASPLHRFGVHDPRGGALHPALLARGLRRAALEHGVDVRERSPLSAIEAGSSIRLRCGDASVEAERAVLAANAWMAHFRELRGDVVVVSSDVVATAPAPALLTQRGWPDGVGAFDARTLIDYWRTTANGRVVFGRGGGTLAPAARIGSRFEHSERRRRWVEAELRRLLPPLVEIPVTHSWAGPVERSATGLLRFGCLGGDDRLPYAIGFAGSGIVPAVAAGRCLASLALGRDDDWASLARLLAARGPGFPPEPFRYLGGLVVQRAIARKEDAEDRGGMPSGLVRFLARYAPGGVASPPGRSS